MYNAQKNTLNLRKRFCRVFTRIIRLLDTLLTLSSSYASVRCVWKYENTRYPKDKFNYKSRENLYFYRNSCDTKADWCSIMHWL